jgi:hypothetical protein
MYTPQQLLDLIHAVNMPAIFDPTLSKKDRAAAIKLAKQQLKHIKQQLRHAQGEIKKRWDGRKVGQAEMERKQLKPYDMINSLLVQSESFIMQLETAITFDNAIPIFDATGLGTVIVGDEELDVWAITTPEDAAILSKEIEITKAKIAFRNARQQIFTSEADLKARKQRHSAQIASNIFFAIVFGIATVVVLSFATNPAATHAGFWLLLPSTGLITIMFVWHIGILIRNGDPEAKRIEDSIARLQQIVIDGESALVSAEREVAHQRDITLPDPRPMLDEAARLIKAGNHVDALKITKRLLDDYPHNPDIHFLASFVVEKHEDKVIALLEALRIDPVHEKSQKRLLKLDPEAARKLASAFNK